MSLPAKTRLQAELVAALCADLDTVERAYRATREGATHEEAKPENDKDTRALEQSYLARGQAMRIDELRLSIAAVRALLVRGEDDAPVTLGALVVLEENGARSTLWIAPAGGGTRLAGGEIQVVTPSSPLGRALIGRTAGEAVDVVLGGRTRSVEVIRVT